MSPLLREARNGHLSVVQYPCERGAEKEAKKEGGETPLHWAAFRSHLLVVQYLREQGGDKQYM